MGKDQDDTDDILQALLEGHAAGLKEIAGNQAAPSRDELNRVASALHDLLNYTRMLASYADTPKPEAEELAELSDRVDQLGAEIDRLKSLVEHHDSILEGSRRDVMGLWAFLALVAIVGLGLAYFL